MITDKKPALLQLIPAEMLLRPGDSKSLKARLFNQAGQFLREVQPQFKLDGPGSIDQNVYMVPSDAGHHAAYIMARSEGLEATARVRIVPLLPWKFDFEDVPLNPTTGLGEPPVTWVGCRYRHVIRNVDGNKVMVKITTIPKGTRSQGWFGHSDLSNYTIQADVLGCEQNGAMPDIGVIGQGYILNLHGKSQELQIRSWASVLNNSREIKFAWRPNVWYTIKLQATAEKGQAILKGKVWPKDQSEPAAWTIELVDPAPNITGSPGLFGNATDAELFLDNIQVTANPAP